MSLVLSAGEQLLVAADATATTTESSVRVSYADIRGTLGSSSAATTGATPVLLAYAPPGAQWAVSGVVVVNLDTVTHTYAFTTVAGSAAPVKVYTVSLQAGYSAQFDAKDWTVYTPQGLPVAGSGGGGGVQSVSQGSGIAVNNSDPTNPVVSLDATSQNRLALAATALQSVTAGTGIAVTSSTPISPVVALNTASQANLALAATAVQPAQLSAVTVGLDYVSGLVLEYSSGNALIVSSGVAGIQSSEKLLTVGTQIGVSGLSLTANTWYHVYLFEATVGGSLTPELEVVTTAPSSPYLGTARSKTGDPSRRYLGSLLTDPSGAFWQFEYSNNVLYYLGNLNQVPFTALLGGTATAETTVSLAGVVPLNTRIAILRNTNSAPSGINNRLNNGSVTFPTFFMNFASGADAFLSVPIKSDLSVSYWYPATPATGGLTIQILGFGVER